MEDFVLRFMAATFYVMIGGAMIAIGVITVVALLI